MQVPKFRCTDKLYVQLTYFHCTAFKIKNQPFASNVLTAASMPAVCRRRDHWVGFFRLTERVPVTRPPPATSPRVVPARKYAGSFPMPRPQSWFLLPDGARASTRPPRPRRGPCPPRLPRLRCGTLPPTSVRGRRRFRDGCTRKYRARRPTCTNGIPPRCGSSSSLPASSSVCRQCGG